MTDKQNLVLVPGLMLDARMWAAQIKALIPLADIIVPDRSLQETIGEVAEYILTQAPREFALAGLSQGGVIALEIMRMAPGRITRLALLDTSDKADSVAARQFRLDEIARARAGQYDRIIEDFLPRLVTATHFRDKRLVEALGQMAADLGPEGYVREQKQMLSRSDYEDLLPRITVPTLVLCGAEDAFFSPVSHEAMASRIPGAVLRVIPESGHMTTMEQPELVNAALRDWLET